MQNIILVGFMGAGKTAVGKKLAQRLQYQFVDVDEEIEKLLQLPIPLIFKKYGAIRFRSEEELMLAKICSGHRQVIATGGGAVLKKSNRETLKKSGLVIWLQADAAEISKRVGSGKGRPLLDGADVAATVARLLAERQALYQEVAHLQLDTGQKSIEQVVDEIFKKVKDEKWWR